MNFMVSIGYLSQLWHEKFAGGHSHISTGQRGGLTSRRTPTHEPLAVNHNWQLNSIVKDIINCEPLSHFSGHAGQPHVYRLNSYCH